MECKSSNSAKEANISAFQLGKSSRNVHHLLVESGRVLGFCFCLVLADRVGVAIVYAEILLGLSELVCC